MKRFELSAEAIEEIDIIAKVSTPESGGFVIFDGRVRNQNEGKEVTHLEYQAYEGLACKEGERLIDDAFEKFDIHKVYCVHRTGDLQIGEAAVRLIVSAKHRGTAFQACEFIIDELKIRVPIWKNEHYTDGSSGWVECHECAKHSPSYNKSCSHDHKH